MALRYIYIYMLVDVSCILYVISLLAQVGDDFGTEGEIKVFRRLCITFVFYLFVDVAWQLVAGGYIAIPREFDYVLCGIGLFAISPVYYFWACFVELRLGSRIDRSRKARMLARAPMLVVLALVLASPLTGVAFYIDEQGIYQHGSLYWVVIVCNAGYVVLSTLHTLMKAYGTTSSMRRREYLDLALCVIGPAATGVLIVLFGSTSVSSLGMTSAILLVYALRQRTCIYSDALTGLDNRRRVDEYFESIREGVSAESPLRVYLCDVNRFKGINDTYGHVKGDAALVAVGRALRDVGGDLGGMVARWGGDEFIVLSHVGEALAGEASSREIPARVMEDRLNETLAHVCETDGLEFPVRLSVGSAVCSSPELSLDDVTRAADQSLYQRKREVKGGVAA